MQVSNLIYDDVVDIHLKLCQLLNEPLSLIQTQEFWDADANESGQISVLELLVDFLDDSLQHNPS